MQEVNSKKMVELIFSLTSRKSLKHHYDRKIMITNKT